MILCARCGHPRVAHTIDLERCTEHVIVSHDHSGSPEVCPCDCSGWVTR